MATFFNAIKGIFNRLNMTFSTKYIVFVLIVLVLGLWVYLYVREHIGWGKLFSKFGAKKKSVKEEEKKELELAFITKVESLKNELPRRGKKRTLEELGKFTREFLEEELFDVSYEITFGELDEKVKHKRLRKGLKDEIISFSNKVSELEYGDSKITDEELQELFKKAEDIAQKLTPKPKTTPKKLTVTALKNHLTMPKPKTAPEKPTLTPKLTVNVIKKHLSKLMPVKERTTPDQINELSSRLKQAISTKDTVKIHSTYSEIKQVYDKLAKEDKEIARERLKPLYNTAILCIALSRVEKLKRANDLLKAKQVLGIAYKAYSRLSNISNKDAETIKLLKQYERLKAAFS